MPLLPVRGGALGDGLRADDALGEKGGRASPMEFWREKEGRREEPGREV